MVDDAVEAVKHEFDGSKRMKLLVQVDILFPFSLQCNHLQRNW